MKDRYINYFNMLLAVQSFLEQNAAVVAERPAFSRAVTRLNEKIESIQALDVKRGDRATGVTGSKNQAEENLVNKIIRVSSAIKAYASENNLADMLNKANLSRSELMKLRDIELVQRTEALSELAAPNAEALEEYGVTAADLTALTNLKNSFADYISEVGRKQGERAGETKNLDELFKDIRAILEDQVDNFAESLGDEHSGFYNQYKAIRNIIDRGGQQKPEEPKV